MGWKPVLRTVHQGPENHRRKRIEKIEQAMACACGRNAHHVTVSETGTSLRLTDPAHAVSSLCNALFTICSHGAWGTSLGGCRSHKFKA